MKLIEHNRILEEEGKYAVSNFEDKNFNYLKSPDKEKVNPEDIISYEIFYRNTGQIKVENTEVTASIPEHCALIENNLKNYDYKTDESSITFKIGDLDISESGSIILNFKVDSPLDNGLEIKPLQVEIEYFKENNMINKSGDFKNFLSSDHSFIVEASPYFSNSYIKLANEEDFKNIDGTLEVFPGDILSYEAVIYNDGNMNAEDIVITIEGIEDLTVLESQEELEPGDNNLTARIPIIEAGKSSSYYFKAGIKTDIENNSKIAPVMKIYCNGEEIVKYGGEITARLLPVFKSSTLGLIDQNGGDTYAGELLKVEITIANTGDITANNIDVNLILPGLFSLYEGSLYWKLDSLDIGESVGLDAIIKVNDGITQDTRGACQLAVGSDELDSQVVTSSSLLITGSRPFTRNYIPIVSLHGIEPSPHGRYEISTGAFELMLSTLKNNGYQTITFMDLLNYLDYGKTLPEKPVIITSDDGYQSMYIYAFPLLKKYGYKMTVFLATGYMGNSDTNRRMNDFDSSIANIPTRPMMIWSEVQAMSGYGCEFLSHS
ncbi:MAG: polysaccharide deacetylase family protein, partial [Candidatus Hydromicrobium sp.]